MKIVVIDKKDLRVHIKAEALKFDRQSVPLRSMELLILNHRTTIETADILRLTRQGIHVLIVAYLNRHFALIQAAGAHGSDLKRVQYGALERRETIARDLLEKKFHEHARHLERHGLHIDAEAPTRQLHAAQSVDEMMGIEGAFARAYFQEYFALFHRSIQKGKRTKRPPKDPVNALLSYWYSLYYYQITTQLLTFGFEPGIGYLHAPFRDHNALASDLLELFRAQINEAVYRVFASGKLEQEHFAFHRGGVYLRYEGRKKVWAEYLELVRLFQPLLNGHIAHLRRSIHAPDS